MHAGEKNFVRVSDLAAFRICPRLAYFRRRGSQGLQSFEAIRAEVLRELSRSLPSALASPDPEGMISRWFLRACDDSAIVYGQVADKVREEVLCSVPDIARGLEAESARMGRDRLMTLLTPFEERVYMASGRLRLSGVLDRITRVDGTAMPTVVVASKPPDKGVYGADRLRLAAYALLLGERRSEDVSRGVVEYACGWSIREIEIRKSDMRAALSVRSRIEEMGTALPEARRGKWCERCRYRSSCEVRVTVLESLFRRRLAGDNSRGDDTKQ